MNKKRIIILSVITLLLLTLTIIINLTDNNKNVLPKYLKSIGFTNLESTTLYQKQISKITEEEHNNNIEKNIKSEYEIHYFNIDTFEYTKNKITYNDTITKDYTPTYSYKNDKITYTYRIYYQNANIIFEGQYNLKNKRFTCTPTFHYQINIDEVKDDICDKLKIEAEIFTNEISTLIEEPNALNYINNNI